MGLSSQNNPIQPLITSHWTQLDHMITLKSEPIMSKKNRIAFIGLDGSGYTLELGTGSLSMRMSKIRALSATPKGEIDVQSTIAALRSILGLQSGETFGSTEFYSEELFLLETLNPGSHPLQGLADQLLW